ncbi:MAG: adenosylcobinamide-GDP ribazoletransferase [Pseudomonadota bacterium]
MSLNSDLVSAAMLLTRLPVRGTPTPEAARAAWAWPLVGAGVGLAAGAVGTIALAVGLAPGLAAALALATSIAVTGALHEDGLADLADGFWGGFDKDRRLAIMRDSRIGTYGVIALFLGLAARWAALWMLFEMSPETAAAAILVAATASRAVMPGVMWALPHARNDGLSAQVGHVRKETAFVAFGLAALVTIIFAGWGGIMALVWALVIASLLARIALMKIGGQTGDILGATQQLAEIAILLSLVAH